MTRPLPRICCLDLDAFYASVERVLDPSLEGKPLIIGGKPGSRGVVTCASYEVRHLGVRAGISLHEAARLAPHAIFLATRHGMYGQYSGRVRTILEGFCPVVQTASIDEFFCDFHGCERLYRRPGDGSDDQTIERVVRRMTAAIQGELGLPASAGVASCRSLSKVACGQAKPAGVLLVPAGQEAGFLAPLPVRKLPGIGPVGERRLNRLGIQTLGQLAALPPQPLRRLFGAWADPLRRAARGRGDPELGKDRPAFQEHDPEGDLCGSISNERTFREDVSDPRCIASMLCSLCERVCWRARKRGARARTVTLRLRYADFQTLTRSRTIPPTSSERELLPVVMEIFAEARTRPLPVRLLGLALSNLVPPPKQLALFGSRASPQVDRAVDRVREQYGFEALRLAEARRRTVGLRRASPSTRR